MYLLYDTMIFSCIVSILLLITLPPPPQLQLLLRPRLLSTYKQLMPFYENHTNFLAKAQTFLPTSCLQKFLKSNSTACQAIAIYTIHESLTKNLTPQYEITWILYTCELKKWRERQHFSHGALCFQVESWSSNTIYDVDTTSHAILYLY